MSSGRKGNFISVVQCTPTCIALLRAKPGKGGVHVLDYQVQRGDWSEDDGSLMRALADFSQQHRLDKDVVYTILPRHQVTIRTEEFPSQDDDEINNMVQLTAEELVPFSSQEIIASQCVLEKLDNGQSKVFVTVVHQDVVNAQIALFRGADIELEQIYLSTSCLMAALNYPVGNDHKDAFLLYADGNSLECVQMEAGHLQFNRGVVLNPAHDLNESIDEMMNSALRETTPHSNTLQIASAILTKELLNGLGVENADLKIEPYESGLRCVKKGVELLNDCLPLALFGAVLSIQKDSAFGIELLPRQVLSARADSHLRGQLVKMTIACTLLLCCIGAVYFQAVGQRESYLETLEQQAEELRPETKSLIIKSKNLRRLQEQVERNITMYQLLGMVTNEVPAEGINLNRFSFRRDDELILQGRATTPEKFDVWIDNLRSPEGKTIELFAQAREMYRHAIKERKKDIWEYSIAIPFPELTELGDGDE
jgi:hypothetical protein